MNQQPLDDSWITTKPKGIVYFSRCRDKVKIGYTTRDAETRVREFETGNPEPLLIIGAFPAPDDYDKVLHRDPRFAPFRVRADREWFYATPEVIGAIENMVREAEQTARTVSFHEGDLIGPFGSDGTYLRKSRGFGWDVIEGYQADAIRAHRAATENVGGLNVRT